MSDSTAPIAGWYPDPEDAAQERWWNGVSWSEERRPSTRPSAPATSSWTSPAIDTSLPPATPYAGAPGYAGAGGETSGPADTPAFAPYYAASAPPANGIGLAGFIVSVVGFALGNLVSYGLVGIVGGILSAVGVSRAKALERQGVLQTRRGLSIAGVWLGFGGAVLLWLGLIGLIALGIALGDVSGPSSYP